MASYTITTRKSKAQVQKLLRSIPKGLAGKNPVRYPGRFWAAFASSFFQSVYDGYLVKSIGGTDETGATWVPLSARRQLERYNKVTGGRATGVSKLRPTLTAAQDKIWRRVFMRIIERETRTLRGASKERQSTIGKRLLKITAKKRAAATAYGNAIGLASPQVKAMAAQIAWTHLKNTFGAETLIQALATAEMPLMIDTGRLIQAWEPTKSHGGYYRPRKNQIYRRTANGVTLGVSVPYAKLVHGGGRNAEGYRVPARPPWGEDRSVWLVRAVGAGLNAVAAHIIDDE